MEPLFRLMLRRPPMDQSADNPSISTVQESTLQQAIANASSEPAARRATLQRIARNYVAGSDFLGDPVANPLHGTLAALADALDLLQAAASTTPGEVATAITKAFDRAPSALVGDSDVAATKRRLRDSIIAIKLLPEEQERPFEALVNQLRDLELIAKVAGDAAFPASPAALRRYRKRSLLLPPLTGLKSVLSTAAADAKRRKLREAAEAERQKQVTALLTTHQGLAQAVQELSSLGGQHLQATPLEAHGGYTPTADLSQANAQVRTAAFYRQLTDLSLKQLQVAAAPTSSAAEPRALVQPMLATQLLASVPRAPTGSPAFRPLALGDVGFLMTPAAVAGLSPATREVLAQRQLRPDETPLDQVASALQNELRTVATQLGTMHAQATARSVTRIGDTAVTAARPLPSAWTDVFIGGVMSTPWPLPSPLPPLPLPPDSVPTTHGTATPAGLADLLVVKQQLVRYEATDISHIENVLKGEDKVSVLSTKQTTQQVTFTEAETTKSEERELQTTDRFEMSRESDSTIKEDAALKAGLTLSGKYGPTVDFSASAEGSTSRSKEEANKSASTYSQEVTERTAKKITERVLQRSSLTVTNEVHERNRHAFDNRGGAAHISGVYQWVNKVYQAQMFNYGLRTMFDFMVPEPAAFYIAAQQVAQAAASTLEKPPPFTLTPDAVSEANYPYWVRLYHATDVAPPPELFGTKGADFKAGGGDEDTDYNQSGQIALDEGYQAIQATVGRVVNTWGDQDLVDVVIGRHHARFSHNSPWIWSTPLDGEVGTVAFAMDTFKASMIALAIEVKCQRTERAMSKWRLETHAKLTTAYQARLAEYEEKLAATKLQASPLITGKNPAFNLELIKDELKKNCISILTDQAYDLFDAIQLSASNGLPQVNVAEAEPEGTYVRFFEQAFEWEEMTWVTYPYFWGRKSQWVDRLGYEDPDPLFNQFLKAGYCRVSVPIRPGFEGAVDHFHLTGLVWCGHGLPPVSSPLYLPIADEIAERLQRPGDEIPQGDPWLVRVPTTLVKLRADDQLPRWTQGADGDWTEV